VAAIRLDNALLLFDEFVQATVKNADAAALRGLERRFAERLQIQPSYWSQIKGRSRQIGERLARQFEQNCRKPVGWMDEAHGGNGAPADAQAESPLPRDDDERFIVGLVLTYYRRHPSGPAPGCWTCSARCWCPPRPPPPPRPPRWRLRPACCVPPPSRPRPGQRQRPLAPEPARRRPAQGQALRPLPRRAAGRGQAAARGCRCAKDKNTCAR
jgi:hypothetical protein